MTKRTSAWKQEREAFAKCVESQQKWMYRALILAGRLKMLGGDGQEVLDINDKYTLQQMLLQINREVADRAPRPA